MEGSEENEAENSVTNEELNKYGESGKNDEDYGIETEFKEEEQQSDDDQEEAASQEGNSEQENKVEISEPHDEERGQNSEGSKDDDEVKG